MATLLQRVNKISILAEKSFQIFSPHRIYFNEQDCISIEMNFNEKKNLPSTVQNLLIFLIVCADYKC